MFTMKLTAAAVFLMVMGLAAAARADERKTAAPADPAKIAELIRQLESDKYDDRQDATRQLDEIGKPALEALKKAADNGATLDLRTRAERLIASIEDRNLTPEQRQIKELTPRIEELIGQLDSDRFANREAACTELQKIGKPALGALKYVLKVNAPLEVCCRVERLIEVIEKGDNGKKEKGK